MPPKKYRAFISYSHRDERFAVWLHKALERYRVPRRLVGRSTDAGIVPARIAPVFRDRDELPSATNLSRVVTAALEQSEAVIVICSPAAAQSRWVNEEIRLFSRLGGAERLFCLIVAGDPAANGDEHCFPPALRERTDAPDEPIAADVRPGKDGRSFALLKIVAGLLGVGLDDLVRREQQRRHRRLVAVAASALAGMAVTSALAALALMARNEAEIQRGRAEIEATTARQTTEFLVRLFEVVDPGEARGNTVTAREIFDSGVLRIERDLASQPEVRANLLHTMGRVYTGLGLYAPATELLGRALELRDSLRQDPAPERIATANDFGRALSEKAEYDEAEAVYREALAGAQALQPDGDGLVSAAMAGIGEVLFRRGDFTGAERQYREALAIDGRLGNGADIGRSLEGLARALLYQERFDESEVAYRDALTQRRAALGDDHPLIALTTSDLATLLYFSGHPDRAEPLFREALALYERLAGHEHPVVSDVENNLGRLLLERGDLAGARDLLSDALAIDRKLKDPGHDDLVFTLNNLGLVWLGLGDPAQAVTLLEEARQIAEQQEHPVMLGDVQANVADAYGQLGRVAAARAAVAAARAAFAAVRPDEASYDANLASIEGAVYVAEGKLAEAQELLTTSFKILEERWGLRGLFTRLAARRLADYYRARGDDEQERHYRRIATAA